MFADVTWSPKHCWKKKKKKLQLLSSSLRPSWTTFYIKNNNNNSELFNTHDVLKWEWRCWRWMKVMIRCPHRVSLGCKPGFDHPESVCCLSITGSKTISGYSKVSSYLGLSHIGQHHKRPKKKFIGQHVNSQLCICGLHLANNQNIHICDSK